MSLHTICRFIVRPNPDVDKFSYKPDKHVIWPMICIIIG
jgi:hypothetical protein